MRGEVVAEQCLDNTAHLCLLALRQPPPASAATAPPQNAEIEAACRGLEAEVAAMREALPRDEAAAGGSGGAAAGQPNGVEQEGMEQ